MDCSTFSCDLHVLGTPPALILSQDQTLVCNLLASPTEVGDAPCPVARKPEAGIFCEIARTYDSSVPRFICSHERTNHLTTGTFNLLSKTESAFRLSGAFQSNSRHSKAPVVLETLSSSRSVQTRRDEPFKITAAILDSSTRSV